MLKFSFYSRSAVMAAALLAGGVCQADEYHTKVLESPAPAEDLAPEIAKALAPTGIAVMRSETSTLCEIWLRKDIPAKADFEATNALLYPFEPGELIGVIRYRRRGADFRDRDIDRGMYTMRFQLQPIDGNHVGTSVTRDFMLLVNADGDKSLQPLPYEKLVELSATAAQATHPAIIALQSPNAEVKAPAVFEKGDDEWKVLQVGLETKTGEKKGVSVFAFVVEGSARE
ncbi:hypothetical protein [Lignipirellula cremea]|uniref:Uncharacterized protein n=1 Tax=Lignipirellula cremea TaxID=2528010 RepID=A0A518DN42_9BACT|nr:hypothetical protein [Lignipirellula cremea]QDU93241.1 hypothetical protein Pla8534_10200 [Lignipirellula cremea]